MHSSATPSQLRAVLLFAASYMSIAAVAAIATGNTEFIFYIVTMALITTGVMAIGRTLI